MLAWLEPSQLIGFGSSDIAAAEVLKRGGVTVHPSALNSPAPQVLVQRDGGEKLRNQGRNHRALDYELEEALRCSDRVRRRGTAEYDFLERCAEYF